MNHNPTLAASFWRTPPSPPRASVRSRASPAVLAMVGTAFGEPHAC
jgi:hypothetical protein